MRRLTYVFVLIAVVLAFSCNESKNRQDTDKTVQMAADERNIIWILADDLGYRELGAPHTKSIPAKWTLIFLRL